MKEGATGARCMRLLGASLCVQGGSAVEYLLGLRSRLSREHEAQGVRCALLYTSGWLVRWYEGPAAAVDAAWRQAEHDPQTKSPRVLLRGEGAAQLTDTVHIATLHDRDTPNDVARRILQIQRQAGLGWTAEPLELWQALSAPCQLQAADPVTAVARREVVALASEDNESVELLRAIAQRCASNVSYQRFAESDPRTVDVGAAYTDLACGTYVTRVLALSRRALPQVLVRKSLTGLHSLVLMLGTRTRSAGLAEGVAALLEATGLRPDVQLVGGDDEAVEAAAGILGRVAGLRLGHMAMPPGVASRVDALLPLIQERQDTQILADIEIA